MIIGNNVWKTNLLMILVKTYVMKVIHMLLRLNKQKISIVSLKKTIYYAYKSVPKMMAINIHSKTKILMVFHMNSYVWIFPVMTLNIIK